MQAPVKHPSIADLLLLDTGLNASTFSVASPRFTVGLLFVDISMCLIIGDISSGVLSSATICLKNYFCLSGNCWGFPSRCSFCYAVNIGELFQSPHFLNHILA